MMKSSVERRLRDVGKRLTKHRDDLRIAEEQLAQLVDEADDARLRALVSETPISEREHKHAARHADKMRRHRADLQDKISELESRQNQLLDEIAERQRP